MQRRGGPIEVVLPGDRVLFEADEEHCLSLTPVTEAENAGAPAVG